MTSTRHSSTRSVPGQGTDPFHLRRVAYLAPALLVGALLALGGCATKPPEPPPQAVAADRVIVKKAERKMQLLKAGQVVREYRVNLGDNPYGHKERQGDERTPEGDYVLDWRNPNSLYHRSIHISYPNAEDRSRAQSQGVDPGGMIMIHGRPSYIDSPRILAEYDNRDWTNGCIAVKNAEMDEVWHAVRDGTPIRILP
jgi:murein L,D-transpeptidase YafK